MGGTVRYDSLGLRLFPLPRAQVHGLTVEDPDRLTGRAALLDVKLSLSALLAGTVRPTAIEVEHPVLEVRLSHPTGSASDPDTVYRESVGPIVDWLARALPGMSVTIADGRLDVLRDGQRIFALSKLAVQAHVATDAIDVRTSAASDWWRAAEGRLRLVPGSLAGTVTLQVRALDATDLLAAIGADGPASARPGPVDASLEAETDGRGAGRATLTASSPQLVLERGTRRLELGATQLAADVVRDPGALTVTLRRLALGDLVPSTTGTLRAKGDGSAPTLELLVSAVDLARVRAAALALAGDLEAVGAMAEIVRAGTLRSLKIAGGGSTLATLADGIRPTAADVERPVLELHLDGPGGASDPLVAYRESVGPLVKGLARTVPGLSVRIVDGRLDVLRDRQRVVALSGLGVEAVAAADAIDVQARASADRWRTAEGRLRIAPGSLAGSAQLQVKGLQATDLLAAVAADAPLTVRPGPVDASLEAETDGRGAGRATLTASSPQLVLERGTRRLELGAARLTVDAAHDPRMLTVTLRQLALGDLLPGATGTFRASAAGGPLTLELLVSALDLARVRAAALALAGDLDAVGDMAGIARAGTLRSVRIAGAGPTLASLADARAIRADAALDAGELALPDGGLTVRDGRGALALANGRLRGSQLSWRIGDSSFRDGALTLQLAPEVSLQTLRAGIDADLGEALAIARRKLDPVTVAALASVEALKGRAAGTFVFDEDGQPDFQLDLTSLTATGRYRGVPFPLALSAGEARYTPDALRVRGLSGTLGRSRVSGVSAELLHTTPITVRAASGEAVLALDELYPWLASLDGLRPALKEVKGVTGTATLRVTRMSGPLTDPDFAATVQPNEVRAVLTPLPAPLTLAGGSVQVTPGTLRLDRIGVALLDARVTASGTVEHNAAPGRRLDLTLAAGAVGAEALGWLRARWKVDPAGAPPARRSPSTSAGCSGPRRRRASARCRERSASPAMRAWRSISPGGRTPSTCGASRSRTPTAMPSGRSGGRPLARPSPTPAASTTTRSPGSWDGRRRQ